ncbi:heparan-alpha-glucosaminide N-acetyltransferase [Rubrobacter marinus]|uniref:heparan-alpha-glucosaminide N-acetyltransferase n=1 Tax=Rubrobacter marinus TaxID=2653852 RepID=UPI00140CA662|nr:heparan-alpha-glucosaminide N-acetyltransferase [Rubrobacter marinus]
MNGSANPPAGAREHAQGKAARLWEVDAARGVAILMVVLYHLVYDLDSFGGYPIDSTSGFWGAFADVSAFAFVFLAGLSLALSHARASGEGRANSFGRYLLLRGARIFAYGMLITLVFWALDFGAVVFGILHLIGASIVLSYPFLKLRPSYLALLGLPIVAAGIYLLATYDASNFGIVVAVLLAPFGIEPIGLSMPDYRPLLPWFGVVLLGLAFGKAAYDTGRPGARTRGETEDPTFAVRSLAFLGRHTLFIYLVHQPVLVAALWVLGVIEPGF